MHYDDEFVTNNNHLDVVIYKHGNGIDDTIYYDLSSIQQCKFIHPVALSKFLKLFLADENQEEIEKSFPELADLKTEAFIMVTFKNEDIVDLKVIGSREWDYKNKYDQEPELGLH